MNKNWKNFTIVKQVKLKNFSVSTGAIPTPIVIFESSIVFGVLCLLSRGMVCGERFGCYFLETFFTSVTSVVVIHFKQNEAS